MQYCKPIILQLKTNKLKTNKQKWGLMVFEQRPKATGYNRESLINGCLSLNYFYPSEGRESENHNHRKLIKLIPWTTALFNSRKLWAMPCKAMQRGLVMVQSSDKIWSTGEGNGINEIALMVPRKILSHSELFFFYM